LSIWAGLTLGVAGFAIIDPLSLMVGLLLPVWLLFGAGLAVPVFQSGSQGGYFRRLWGRFNIVPQFITLGYVVRTIPLFFGSWLSWTVGFYLVGRAVVVGNAFDWQVMFAFPFAATIGILAIVFPGGLGVREGLLVYFMVQCGTPITEATVVSIIARLWFLVGEIFIFLVAVFLHIRVKKTGPLPFVTNEGNRPPAT
jgi:hypothetical protein